MQMQRIVGKKKKSWKDLICVLMMSLKRKSAVIPFCSFTNFNQSFLARRLRIWKEDTDF